MEKNICRFLPVPKETGDINILNFVYETKKRSCDGLQPETVYKMHLVVGGEGRIHTLHGAFDLKCGDVFFTWPSMSCAIESGEDFEYMYISCIGLRMRELMDRIGITSTNFIFEDMGELEPIWASSIIDDKSILNLRCEGILLYSFSVLGEQTAERRKENDDIVQRAKKYIDDNFDDGTLSLERLSDELSYNKKYISGVFKRRLGIGITQYITRLRVQYACTLVDGGFTSVSDIAVRCGFSDPLYFSRVFKSVIGTSPKEYIKESEKRERARL